ncbi:MAG: leucine-rich repeat domain-containing protein [Spirochaetaceae bacterium]|nr:leucine-rich repeat domain-containing protein [Spirochaetaceae bacterium]
MLKKLLPFAAMLIFLCAACENPAGPSGAAEELFGLEEAAALLAELPPNTADTPHTVELPGFDISSAVVWNTFMGMVRAEKKYLALDLSTAAGSAFAGGGAAEYIVSIVFPEGLLTMGSLKGSPVLKTVTLPDSLVSIGSEAFAACPVLETVSFPAVTENVYYRAFQNSPLVSFEVRGSGPLASPAYPAIPAGKLLVRNGVTLVLVSPSLAGNITVPAHIAALGEGAFYGHTGITGVTLPDGITAIGRHTFSGCENLAAVTVPPSVTVIGQQAFQGCAALASFTFPPSVEVGDLAFYGSGLIAVTVPPAARLGEQVFKACSRLVNAGIQTQNFGEHLFADSAVEHVTLPANLAALPGGTFYNCDDLLTVNSTTPGTVNLPATLVSLGGSAFTGCRQITAVDMSGLTLVPAIPGAFLSGCNNLETLVLPPTITQIQSTGAFMHCQKLRSVSLPAGVTTIGVQAFYNAFLLANVYVHAPVPPEIVHTNDAAQRKPSFYGNAVLLTIHVPAGSLAAYRAAWADVVSPDRFVAIE